MENCIMITQKKDEIIIKINEEAEITEVLKELKEKIEKLKKFYNGEQTPISVTGKILKSKEIEEIKKLIEDEIEVEIKFADQKELGLSGIKKAFEKDIDISEAKFLRGSIRSGQKIEYEGSIVIIGDVNAGAEIIAGEHIIVLGALRGLAHAGARGNKKAIISANLLEVPQIRIANIVKEFEKEEQTLNKVYVFADLNEIEIEKF